MEMMVLWTDSAIEELQQLHDYLFSVAGSKVADKCISTIVDRTLHLEKNPRSGQAEDLLQHRKEEIRYLVEGNYKIVYLIDQNTIFIAAIFDCRQNPLQLKKTKI